MSVGELKTTRLSSPTGTIVIEGDLLITHSREVKLIAAADPLPTASTHSTARLKRGGGRGLAEYMKERAFSFDSLALASRELTTDGIREQT
jgi:hypothetical protein